MIATRKQWTVIALSLGYAVGIALAEPSMFSIDSVQDNLITINLNTGAGTAIGPIGFDSHSWGLAIAPVPVGSYTKGTLFGVETNTSKLYRINTATGAATAIGSGLGAGWWESLSFDLAGNLYAVSNNALYTVNVTTGSATQIAAGGLADIDGLDVTPVPVSVAGYGVLPAGTMFAVDSGGLYYFSNLGAGTLVSIGSPGQSFVDETLAFAPDGTLYGLGTPVSNYDLNKIGLNPLIPSFVGSTGFANLWGSAITPEPATLLLLALGGFAMLRRRR